MTKYTIERYKNITRIIDVQQDELNLDKTLNCGQAFRWNKIDNITWCGVIRDKIVLLANINFDDGISGIATNLNIDDAQELIDYLDLCINYNEEVSKLKYIDPFALKAYERGKGIHILRQDLLEIMVTFLMSQCNTMHNIRNIINNLCTKYGNKITTEWNGVIYTNYTFPTLEVLSTLNIEDFKACKMGFRAQYLYEMCKELNDSTILETLQSYYNGTQKEYEIALNILKQFKGISDKVANCICLFGLHQIQAFPIDTHIKKLISQEYGNNFHPEYYENIAGIIQQYMYYYQAFKGR